tara:strand:+ start:117 stop:422 length:306 start_codon:yes stop_codon:yes gene_type:complete
MSKNKLKLSTGRAVQLKEMSIDDIDMCTDTTVLVMKNGEIQSIGNISKARTAWIRKGLIGGDFKNFKMNGNVVDDSVLKQLTDDEKNELSNLIQEHQKVGE